MRNQRDYTKSWLAVMAIAGMFFCATAQATTFSDGNFSSLDWLNREWIFDDPQIPGTGPGTSSTSISTPSNGGNPGPYRQSIHRILSGDVVYTEGLNTAAVHNPATQGAIEAIDYTVDLRHPNTDATAWHLLVEQDGTRYYSIPLGVFSQDTTWKSFSRLNLREDDFDTNPLSGFFGEEPDGNSPDFSDSGSVLRFGYALGNTLTEDTFRINTVSLDNWSIMIDVVPWTGDYDKDDDVDGKDILIWQRDIRVPEALTAWKMNFGDTGLASFQRVPEPSPVVLATIGLLGLVGIVRPTNFRPGK